MLKHLYINRIFFINFFFAAFEYKGSNLFFFITYYIFNRSLKKNIK